MRNVKNIVFQVGEYSAAEGVHIVNAFGGDSFLGGNAEKLTVTFSTF